MMNLNKLLLLGFIVSALVGCGPGRPDLRTIELNREGNKQVKAQVYAPAAEKYIEALRYDPFVGALHLNLGLTFEGTEQAEKAIQSYKQAEALALKDKDAGLVFMARFNQGQLLGKAKRIEEALAVYQKALEIIPTSKETKINIELLTQSGGGGGGEGENKDDKNGDQKDQKKNGQGKDKKDKDGENKEKDKDDGKGPKEPEEKKQSPKYQPRPFAGKDLSEGDVKKILGELKQQEEKIRAEYNRKDVKEQPRDKDW